MLELKIIKKIKSHFLQSRYWMDIAHQVSGNAMAQAIGVLAMPVVTRLYTPEDYSILSLFMQIVFFINILITFRYEYFINLSKNKYRASNTIKTIITIGFTMLPIILIILYFGGNIISEQLNNKSIVNYLIVSPFLALLISISIAFQFMSQWLENYKVSGRSEIVNKFGVMIFSIILYFIFESAWGLVLATICGYTMKVVYLYKFLNGKLIDKYINVKKRINIYKKVAIKYGAQSSSMVFSNILLTFTATIPSVFILKEYGSFELGQFALVNATLYLPSSLIGSAIGQVYYQRASKNHSQGKGFNDLWKTTAKKLMIISLPIYIIISMISPWVYPLIFGNQWYMAGEMASIISIAAFFSMTTTPLDKAYLIVNAWKYIMIFNILRATTTFLVVWFAIENNININLFLGLLVFQMVSMYLIDYFVQWRLSFRQYAK